MHKRLSTIWSGLAVAPVSYLLTGPALAHHAMDGKLPTTLMEGLISGLAHPIIGYDHLAFVIAVGLVAALVGSPLLIPVAFIIGTLLGAGIHLAGITLPMAEVVIALSVLAIGAAVMLARRVSPTVIAACVAFAGVFHGFAYAESIVGSEATPLVAYLAGFAMIQIAISVGAPLIATHIAAHPHGLALAPRFAGAMVAGIGIALVADRLKALVFPSIS